MLATFLQQKNDLDINEFHLMRRVLLRWSWSFILSSYLGYFFFLPVKGLFKTINGFIRVSTIFLRCFQVKKRINMRFWGLRSRASIFQPPSVAKVQPIDDASFATTNKLSSTLFFEKQIGCWHFVCLIWQIKGRTRESDLLYFMPSIVIKPGSRIDLGQLGKN